MEVFKKTKLSTQKEIEVQKVYAMTATKIAQNGNEQHEVNGLD